MKKSLLFALLFVISITFFACKDDDDSTNNQTPKDPMVGTWLSEGTNVAPLLRGAPFKIKKITATFNENLTYTVVQVDSNNVSTTLTGTYTLTKSATGTIHKIVVNQQTPAALTAEGIYEINTTPEPAQMSYEVVQTSPAIGVAPPTPTGGFGSTGGGVLGTLNVQKYVRVN